jgi:hypothetical protein
VKILLHIGAPKTGSSAIQTFLSINRAVLAERFGVVYPEYPFDKTARLGRPTTGNGAELARLAIRTPPGDLGACIEALLPCVRSDATVVLSSELLWPMEEPTIHALREAFAPFGEFRVLFYAGGQARLLASGYWQSVKNHGRKNPFPEYARERGGAFEYARRLALFRRVLGDEGVTLRPYVRTAFPEGDIVLDFLASLGVPQDAAACLELPRNDVNATADAAIYVSSLVNNLAGGAPGWLQNSAPPAELAALVPMAVAPARRPDALLSNAQLREVAERFRDENRRLARMPGMEGVDLDEDNRAFVDAHAALTAFPAATPMELLLLQSLIQLRSRVAELERKTDVAGV